jgi:hypothetical protein
VIKLNELGAITTGPAAAEPPVTDNPIDCGEIVAVDGIDMDAVRNPGPPGVAITFTTQLAAGCSVPQFVVAVKSPGFVPENDGVPTVTAEFPLFATITTSVEL